jgi:Tfp pilus assembly protein FimT
MMMRMQKSKAPKQTPRTRRGFSTIELLITATILTIVTGFGLMGISRAKASIRLSGSAREFASYIEKSRLYSIRRHADEAAERANVAINDNKTSYNVTMDLDGDGGMDTRTINLPSGVQFETVESIAFDWRGRTWNTVGALTMPNAQVSITLKNGVDTVSIDITGSGDITIDSKVFDDEVPDVRLNVGDLASGATTPGATSTTPPTGTTGSTGTTGTTTGTTGTTDPVDGTGTGTTTTGGTTTGGTGTGSGTTTSPTPTPTPTPRPTPTPSVCTITTDLPSLALSLDGTASIKVGHSSTTSVAITASSSKASELQVTPGGSQTVAAGSTASFTVKSKKSVGTYSVTFSSNCGSKTVVVVVAAVSLF